ncbi:hypothetical protein M011DRAFT_39733 [Sporormia fimetaria CBS 119925]|uniref:Uncharacterized protein n=1 Tax=Sporormia fimetaria CBS 119925 TaxID=1340428 RepID=A0A6A6VD47_9PLEO|nr:hypothetical protein M011DRAFT_39733 [Sporormia fimetaria CBS 119925]
MHLCCIVLAGHSRSVKVSCQRPGEGDRVLELVICAVNAFPLREYVCSISMGEPRCCSVALENDENTAGKGGVLEGNGIGEEMVNNLG